MKSLLRIFTALLLVFVFTFNVVSCDLASGNIALESENQNETTNDENGSKDDQNGNDNTDSGDNGDGGDNGGNGGSDNTGDNGNGGDNGGSDDTGDNGNGGSDDTGDNGNSGSDGTGDSGNKFGDEYSPITIAEARAIAQSYTSVASTQIYYVVGEITEITSASNGRFYIEDETGSIYVYKSTYIDGSKISATTLSVGDIAIVSGTLRNYQGTLEIETGTVIDFYDPDDIPDPNDPYANVDVDEFYANYTPATSYLDAYYRSKHNLLSGSLGEQDQAPKISANRPTSGGKYIKNSSYLFSADGNTYYVVDSSGNVVMEIYRGGAYIMLEEVAAYVFAFGEPPANQTSDKNASPSGNPWGEFLRLNNTKFSGDTSRYPYEPVLPRISGCGGDLTYYEMDIGTTGTDCDPTYTAAIYNNGSTITRGAARIVYSCYDTNGNKIIELDERYVFYTYNHYNDFQEYLNYYGGWGEMFGNITGGGTISSKTDYNPTDYVQVVLSPLAATVSVRIIYAYFPREEYDLCAA